MLKFSQRMVLFLTLICAWFFVAAPMPISAHAMYQSAVLLDFDGNRVKAELQLPVDRLSIAFKQTVDGEHFNAERDQLKAYILEHVHPVTLTGTSFRVQFLDESIQTVEQAPYLVVHLMFTPPTGASVDHFKLNYDVIAHQIVTHVVLISVRSDKQNPVPADDPVLLGMIRYTKLSQNVDRPKH